MTKKTFKLPTSIIVFSFLFMLIPNPAISPASSLTLNAQETVETLPILDILLRVIKDAKGSITHVEVSLEMSSTDWKSRKPFSLRAPVKYTTISGIADRIEDLRVTDDEGIVDLKQLEDLSEAGGMILWRKWQPSRPVTGIVKVKYRSRLPEAGPRLPGPPYDLSRNGGGASDAGCGFMALPDESGQFKLRLYWDLKAFGPGSAGISSLGDGDVETEGPIDRIFQSYFLAGPLGKYPEQGSINGFSSAWLGTPPFDVQELMGWSAKVYMVLRSFFRDTSPDSYRFFMRVGPANSGGGGTALYNSFMLFVPVEPELARNPRGTIFHEMTHKWVGEIEGSPGKTFWFSEGLTVHYTSLLMYRAGLFTADEYLKDVNDTVTSYMTNPLRNLPNDQIANLFWEDRNAQRLPYTRGSLYFAHVDAEIRSATKGKRSLDDVVLSLFERRKKGENLTKDVLLEALKNELGPSALTDFYSIIIQGKDFIPASEAFGPEFERIPATLRRFELGFDERNSLSSSEKRIIGLVKGSAAERAGLQNGDQILNTIDLYELRENEDLRLELMVRRGDQVLEIEYLPRGDSVEGYKWVRKTGVSGRPGTAAKATLRNVPSVTRHRGTFNGHSVAYTTKIEEIAVSDSARVAFAKSLLGEGRRVTQHSVMIRGARVEYEATVGGVILEDSASRPAAILTYIGYTRIGVSDAASRPITFAWNGGPSVSSTGLHLGVLGPRRQAVDDKGRATLPAAMADNPHSILDRTDLVMVDPIGTGFSVPIGTSTLTDFYSIKRDAASVAQFIKRYLEENGRLQSPVYIIGESYGTVRNAVVANILQSGGVQLAGIIFVASALDGNTIWETSGHLEPYYFYLPTYAAIAWYHNRLPQQPKDLQSLIAEVEQLALNEFVTTLLAWPKVTAAARASVLDKLHKYTGLSKEYWEKAGLRVGTVEFAQELLRDEDRILTISDGRQSSPAPRPGAPSDGRRRGGSTSLMMTYLHDELGVVNSPEYYESAPGADAWEWFDHGLRTRSPRVTGFQNFLDDLAAAMKANPRLRVQQHSGLFDLQCAAFPANWAMERMNIPEELRRNVQMFNYASGHAVFNNAQSEFLKFTENLAAFYEQAPVKSPPKSTEWAGGDRDKSCFRFDSLF
jgi:carboxypeptidase C (cathepsin A)